MVIAKDSKLGKWLVHSRMNFIIYSTALFPKPTAWSPVAFITFFFSHLTVPQLTSSALVKPFYPLFTKSSLLLSPWYICYTIPSSLLCLAIPHSKGTLDGSSRSILFFPIADIFGMGITFLFYYLALNISHSLVHLICIANITISSLVIEFKSGLKKKADLKVTLCNMYAGDCWVLIGYIPSWSDCERQNTHKVAITAVAITALA